MSTLQHRRVERNLTTLLSSSLRASLRPPLASPAALLSRCSCPLVAARSRPKPGGMSQNSSPRWDDFSDASDAWLSPEPDRDGPGHPGKLPLGLAQTVLDDGFPYECGRQRVRPAPRLVAGRAPQMATRERTGSSATFEDLPSEIARMILRENVVLPQVGDWYELNDEQWRERRDELLSYSLVSPVLREESRREMLRFVHVVGEDGLRLLRWSLAQGGDTRARFVRIFTFARPEGLPRDLVRDATAHDVLAGVLPGLPALRQLSLDGTRLDIDTLANLPGLSWRSSDGTDSFRRAVPSHAPRDRIRRYGE